MGKETKEVRYTRKFVPNDETEKVTQHTEGKWLVHRATIKDDQGPFYEPNVSDSIYGISKNSYRGHHVEKYELDALECFIKLISMGHGGETMIEATKLLTKYGSRGGDMSVLESTIDVILKMREYDLDLIEEFEKAVKNAKIKEKLKEEILDNVPTK